MVTTVGCVRDMGVRKEEIAILSVLAFDVGRKKESAP